MLIDENLIELDAVYKNKNELIKRISHLFYKDNKLLNENNYVNDVIKRDDDLSTNLGDGIAMPHARSKYVSEAGLAFVRLKEPINWGTEKPVKLVFQIAVPENGNNLHLKILASLSRKLIYPEFKNKLFNINNKKELFSVISEATGGLLK